MFGGRACYNWGQLLVVFFYVSDHLEQFGGISENKEIGAIESYVFTGLLRYLISMGGWPQSTRGSRRSRSARAQGR